MMSAVGLQRLHRQGISRWAFTRPDEAVAWLGAMQGQDYAGAKWSVGLRLREGTDSTVEQAISAHHIVRTWLLRGTLHLVAGADVRWLLALVAPRLITGNARRYRELELDDDTLRRSNDILIGAVRDGRQLTRPELFAILEQHGISTRGQRGVYMLQRASLEGLICQSVTRKNDPTFVALDDAVPQLRPMARDGALAELAKRYFVSHGPATLPDFTAWSGLTASEARFGLAAAQSALAQSTIDGMVYWQSPSPLALEPAPAVHLLPGFDEFLLGYRERGAVLDPQHAHKLHPGGNGVFRPTIVSDGRVVGTWTKTVKKGAALVEAHPFTVLTEREKAAFAEAAQRYGKYLGMPITVSG